MFKRFLRNHVPSWAGRLAFGKALPSAEASLQRSGDIGRPQILTFSKYSGGVPVRGRGQRPLAPRKRRLAQRFSAHP